MVLLYRSFLVAAFAVGFIMATPTQAQTSATLNVTVQVVEECVISAEQKRRLARLARKTGRLDILQRCSKGVVSRVNQRRINPTVLQPARPLPRRISKTRVAKATSAGQSDVVLVTVTY